MGTRDFAQVSNCRSVADAASMDTQRPDVSWARIKTRSRSWAVSVSFGSMWFLPFVILQQLQYSLGRLMQIGGLDRRSAIKQAGFQQLFKHFCSQLIHNKACRGLP